MSRDNARREQGLCPHTELQIVTTTSYMSDRWAQRAAQLQGPQFDSELSPVCSPRVRVDWRGEIAPRCE